MVKVSGMRGFGEMSLVGSRKVGWASSVQEPVMSTLEKCERVEGKFEVCRNALSTKQDGLRYVPD